MKRLSFGEGVAPLPTRETSAPRTPLRIRWGMVALYALALTNTVLYVVTGSWMPALSASLWAVLILLWR